MTAGVRAAPGAFLLSMSDEPGWSTGALSASRPRSGSLMYGLAGPISGRLMGRLRDPRRRRSLSLIVTAVALLASSVRARDLAADASSSGSSAGLGSGLVASVLGPTIATRWFIRDRGLVIGIFGASVERRPAHLLPVPDDAGGHRRLAARGDRHGRHRVRPDRARSCSGSATTRPTSGYGHSAPIRRRGGPRAASRTAGSCAGPSGRPTSGSSRRRSSSAARPRTA